MNCFPASSFGCALPAKIELDGELLVHQGPQRPVEVPEEQRCALVGGEAPGEPDGEHVGREHVVVQRDVSLGVAGGSAREAVCGRTRPVHAGGWSAAARGPCRRSCWTPASSCQYFASGSRSIHRGPRIRVQNSMAVWEVQPVICTPLVTRADRHLGNRGVRVQVLPHLLAGLPCSSLTPFAARLIRRARTVMVNSSFLSWG